MKIELGSSKGLVCSFLKENISAFIFYFVLLQKVWIAISKTKVQLNVVLDNDITNKMWDETKEKMRKQRQVFRRIR